MSRQKIILIAGPTASGKSALALDLARRHKGTIINADAMQVYAGLPVLTAQPGEAERRAAPHELYGTLDPSQACSAGIWRGFALAAINKAVKEGCTPILVGGTGLYFKVLLEGLADIPDIPAEVRSATQALYEKLGEEAFRFELAKHDPVSAARLAKNDRQRLIRAYEVAVHTGQAIGEWHKKGSAFGIQHSGETSISPSFSECQMLNADPHLLMPPRDELYAACDRRFAKMMAGGAVEEAKAFLARGLDPALPVMKTIGLREIGACLAGEMTLEEATAKAQQATRNYAKRQVTWFKNQWDKMFHVKHPT